MGEIERINPVVGPSFNPIRTRVTSEKRQGQPQQRHDLIELTHVLESEDDAAPTETQVDQPESGLDLSA